MKKDKPCYLTILAVAALLFVTPPLATGVEAAQPISDREIIASLLSELKAGQKALETRMDRHSEILQQQIDQPFGAVDQGFEAVDQHFERVNQRFEAIHRRLDEISALMFVTIAGIFGLIGYIAWDR